MADPNLARDGLLERIRRLESQRESDLKRIEKYRHMASEAMSRRKRHRMRSRCSHDVALFIDRKRVEEELQHRTALLEALLSSSNDGILAIDPQGKRLLQNRRTTEMWNIPKEMAENKDTNAQRQHVMHLVKNQEQFAANVSHLNSEVNERCWDEIELINGTVLDRYSAPIIGKDGQILGRLWTFHEITERKRAEEELRMSEEKFSTVFQRSPIAMGIHDLQDDSRCIDVNEAFEQVSGFRREEVIGRTITELAVWPHPDQRAELHRQMKEFGRVRNLEHSFRRKNGEIGTGLLSLETIAIRGKQYSIGFVVDITERKQEMEKSAKLAAQLQQAQKMESVGRLAGGVAHDFNNMLGVILGHTEMAIDQSNPAGPIYESLLEIQKAAERSANLTRQLLAFARKQTVTPKILDLNETIAGLIKMLERMIGENIILDWNPGAGLWPVRVDPSQIDQILTNLCVNARDAIEDVGHITIETGNVALDREYCAVHEGCVAGDYVRIAVRDNGRGMDESVLENIFEPFFTTKETGQGTGLGLATVYGAVKQNNGAIDIQSKPGVGTAILIYLPRFRVRTGTEQAQMSPIASFSPGKETILVVEDEPSILKLTSSILNKHGYTVLAANTPGEAIHFASEHSGDIHLLLTDVIMPEMNGRALAKNLLSFYPRMMCLFMSGYTDDVIAHHGVLEDGVGFLQKPFSIQSLTKKVREILDARASSLED